MSDRSGLEKAANTALNAKKLAAIAKAAAIGGIKGAIAQAAKEYSPQVIKAILVMMIILILLPFLIFAALPNILFQYDTSSSIDVTAMTLKAKIIENAYKATQDYNSQEVDRIIQELSEGFDDVEVAYNPSDVNHYWFIAICSVAYNQDLFAMNAEDIKNRTIMSYIFNTSEEDYEVDDGETTKTLKKLKISVSELNPDELMDNLGFTDEQKNWATVLYRSMADDQNIRPGDRDYLGDDLINYGDIIYTEGQTEVVYFNQGDSRWGNKLYGKYDTIKVAGCGPTALAMVVSSLTNTVVDPGEMADWAYENGYRVEGSGSSHALIPNGAEHFGLDVVGTTRYEGQKIVDALSSGKLVIAIMGPGHFTTAGHFIVLRGVTSEGKILVADPASTRRSGMEWDLSIVLEESRRGAGAGGPFWIISN